MIRDSVIEGAVGRDSDGKLPSYAWPGGYPFFYLTDDGDTACPDCANGENQSDFPDPSADDSQWTIVGVEVNWEDTDMVCCHCNSRIQSAYVDDEEEED